jgi:acyl-CoA hydrolase
MPPTPNSPYFIRTPAYPWLLDEAGFVRAGHVLKLIDIAGSEAAVRHLNRPPTSSPGLVVTASLDRTNFQEPIRLWEMICLESRISRVWQKSLETEVRVWAENFITGQSHPVATAYLVFVALDARTREKRAFPPLEPVTEEDKRLAQTADLRKANRTAEGKTAPFIPIEEADQPLVITRPMTPNEANAQSNVFGGVILSLMDEVGSLAASRQALNQTIVGVRQDRMSFIAPTFIGETVEAQAIITKTWHTSMEVQVEVHAINPNLPEPRRVASSYLVYVKLGPNGRPGEVPPWTPGTPLQKQRAERAELRRAIRLTEEDEARQLADGPSTNPPPGPHTG